MSAPARSRVAGTQRKRRCELGHLGDTSARRPAAEQHVVDRRGADRVVDTERGAGVALRVEVDDEHPQPVQRQRRGRG